MRKWLVLYLIIYFAIACEESSGCSGLKDSQNDSNNEHKSLFQLNVYDVLGAFCILLASALANASGLGGGLLMTIILLMVFQFNVSNSLSLSQVTVCAGTLIAAASRINLRHPTRDKPAIDYELLLLIITPLLAGTTLGVLIAHYTPMWVFLTLLTLMLTWMTYESGVGALKAYNIENKERAEKLNLEDKESEDGNVTYVTSEIIAIPLRKIIESEKKIAPPTIVTMIFFIYVFMLVAPLLRGGDKIDSIVGLHSGSSNYLIATYTYFGICLVISIAVVLYLKKRIRKKIMVGYNFDDYDLIWNFTPSLICLASALFAGISSGFFSVGGGLVMSPIMLKLGMRPQVVVSTSSVLYVLTSSLAVITYAVSGIKLDYSLWVAAFSLIGSVIGIIGMRLLVKRFQRTSIMVLGMTILLALCTLIAPVYFLINPQDLHNN